MQDNKRQAAIYCRVASKDDFAIEHQRQSLRRFAASQGFDDCVECLDNGVNGLTLDRPALNHLNDDMTNGTIQVVFVLSASRIGRGVVPTSTWLNFAKLSGVEVISQNEDILNDEVALTLSSIINQSRRKRK